jgi:anti-sigma factor RsiW
MNCQEARNWLDAHLDGQLDLPHSVEVERHMAGCPACSAARQNLFRLRKQTQAAAYTAPEFLRRSVVQAIEREAGISARRKSKPMQLGLGWILGTATAAVLLVAVMVGPLLRSNSEGRLLDELADSHVRSMMGGRVVDVASSDQHTVRPWFEGKVDFAVPVPDLSSHGFEIQGGRLDYISGQDVAALVYQRRKHFISLFIWPSGRKAGQGPSPTGLQQKPAQRGYQILTWTAGGMTYWAVSEIGAGELEEFAQACLAATQSGGR